MRASELIKILTKDIENHGDLEIVQLVGEMCDPEVVTSVDVKTAELRIIPGGGVHMYIPYNQNKITNAKIFLLG